MDVNHTQAKQHHMLAVSNKSQAHEGDAPIETPQRPTSSRSIADATIAGTAPDTTNTTSSSAGVIHGSNTPFRRSMAIQAGNMENFQQQLHAQAAPNPPDMNRLSLEGNGASTGGGALPPAPPVHSAPGRRGSRGSKTREHLHHITANAAATVAAPAAAPAVNAAEIDHFGKDVDDEYDSDDDSEGV